MPCASTPRARPCTTARQPMSTSRALTQPPSTTTNSTRSAWRQKQKGGPTWSRPSRSGRTKVSCGCLGCVLLVGSISAMILSAVLYNCMHATVDRMGSISAECEHVHLVYLIGTGQHQKIDSRVTTRRLPNHTALNIGWRRSARSNIRCGVTLLVAHALVPTTTKVFVPPDDMKVTGRCAAVLLGPPGQRVCAQLFYLMPFGSADNDARAACATDIFEWFTAVTDKLGSSVMVLSGGGM